MRLNFFYVFLLAFYLWAGVGTDPVKAQVQGLLSTPSDSAGDVQAATDALIQVLQDPDKRDALIKELQKSSEPSNEAVGDGSSEVSDPVADKDEPLYSILARYTGVLATNVDTYFDKAKQTLSGLSRLARGEVTIKGERAFEAAGNIAFVLIVAYLFYWIAQNFFKRFVNRMAVKYSRSSWFARGFILLVLSAIDALTVLLACVLAFLSFLVPFTLFQREDFLVEVTLDAFWAVGLAKVLLRFVFAPGRPELRLMPFGGEYASYWFDRLFYVAAFLGFGLLLFVPYVNFATSFVIGNALRFVLVLSAALIVIGLIYRQRDWVARGVRSYADQMSNSLVRQTVVGLGLVWHWIAIAYVITLFMLWFTRPFDALEIAVRSTGLSILAIMVGLLISLAITKPIKRGIRLPENIKTMLPAFEGRLNAFIPTILKIFRFAVFIFTVFVLMDIWGLTGFTSWLASAQGEVFVGRGLSALIVLAVSFVIWLGVMAWIDLRLRVRSGYVVTARERTLFQLFRNAFTMIILVMAALLALSEIGINIGPLIAGAGVVGLAISFGAQTLVKDIITGAFIQIENAINEGDVVTVAGVTGVVERLTVRSVRIRDLNGAAHIVPFSSVDMVANFMRDFSYHVAEIGVAYDTDIKKAKAAMIEAFRRLKESEAGTKIIGDLEMHGVTLFADSAINIRARIKTLPGEQWSLGRSYNEFIKDVFDEEGIEIPFPQVTYHMSPGGPAPDRSAGSRATKDEDEPTEADDNGGNGSDN